MKTDWTQSAERFAFGMLIALILAPVVAQGVWRPLIHLLGPATGASAITLLALAIGATIVLAHRVWPARALGVSLGLGAVIALGSSVAVSLGAAGAATLLIVTIVLAAVLSRLGPQLPTSLDGLARSHKGLTVLYLVVVLMSLASVARVSVFMGDPTRVELQALPGERFLETHSCLTAYVRADALSRQRVDNLYADRWWHGSHGFAPLARGIQSPYGRFDLDYYAYPPPFLLIMAPLAPLDGDYMAQRSLWFGLNGTLLALGLWVMSRWLDGPHTHRVLLLAPIFFASLPVLATLQVGNFQIAVVVISLLAMVAFNKDRGASGGVLLAFAILSKLSPSLLGVVLLAQRRWKSALWAGGFGVVLLALSALLVGLNPLRSFVYYTLPRLSSGAAFGFMDDAPFSIVTNMSLFGLPFKLQMMGVHVSDPWAMGRTIGRCYTVFLLGVSIVGALRPRHTRREQALLWMALLLLGALQSPFAPGYVLIAILWAITLLSTEVRSTASGVGLVLLWIGLTVVPPWPQMSLFAAHSVLQSALALLVPVWLIFRRPSAPVDCL